MLIESGNVSVRGGAVDPVDGFTARMMRCAPSPRIARWVEKSASGCHSTTTSVAVIDESGPRQSSRAKCIVDASEPDAPSTVNRPSLCATMRAMTNGSPDSDSKNETEATTITKASAITPRKIDSTQRPYLRRRGTGGAWGVSINDQNARPTEKCK